MKIGNLFILEITEYKECTKETKLFKKLIRTQMLTHLFQTIDWTLIMNINDTGVLSSTILGYSHYRLWLRKQI